MVKEAEGSCGDGAYFGIADRIWFPAAACSSGCDHQLNPTVAGIILVGIVPVAAYSYRASRYSFVFDEPRRKFRPNPAPPPIPERVMLPSLILAGTRPVKKASKNGSNIVTGATVGAVKLTVRRK
jgi:hypothetical protein